jgi:dihydroorotase
LEMCTTRPAQFLKMQGEIGTLRTGARADIAIFELAEGRFEFMDSSGEKRIGSEKLLPRGVIRGGIFKCEKDRLSGNREKCL